MLVDAARRDPRVGDGLALREAFADVAALLRTGRAPAREAVDRFVESAAGTDLGDVAAECAERLGRQAPGRVYRWLTLAPASADLYHEEARHRFAALEADARARGQVPCWGWSWVAEGCVTAYEATGQARFAELLIDAFLDLLDQRDDRRGRADVLRGGPLPTWGVPAHWWQRHGRPAFDGGWTTLVDTAGRVAYPVLRLTRLLAADGHPLAARAGAAGVVDHCAAALAVFDPDFDVHAATGAGFYRRRVDGEVEPLNHSVSAGRALLELAAVTGDRDAAGKAASMARCFRWALRRDGRGAYVWPYQPDPVRRRSSGSNHVWKADVDASFAVSCHEHGVAFTGRDLDRFARTFLHNVVLPTGELNAYISRDRVQPLSVAVTRRTGRVRAPGVVTWNLLGQREPAIWRRLDEEVAGNIQVFRMGWFTSPRTGRAYAQRMHHQQRPRGRRLARGGGRRVRLAAR